MNNHLLLVVKERTNPVELKANLVSQGWHVKYAFHQFGLNFVVKFENSEEASLALESFTRAGMKVYKYTTKAGKLPPFPKVAVR